MCPQKVRPIHMKTLVLQCLLRHRCLPGSFVKYLRTPFLQYNSEWLLPKESPIFNSLIAKSYCTDHEKIRCY